jgi:hypothetical protein
MQMPSIGVQGALLGFELWAPVTESEVSDLRLDVERALGRLRKQGDAWAAELIEARYGLGRSEKTLTELAREHRSTRMAARVREAEQLLGRVLYGYGPTEGVAA